MIPRRNFVFGALSTIGLPAVTKLPKEHPTTNHPSFFPLNEKGELAWKWAEIDGKLIRLPVIIYFTADLVANVDEIFKNPVTNKIYGPDFKIVEAYAWLPFDRARITYIGGLNQIFFWGAVNVTKAIHPDHNLNALKTFIEIHMIPESKRATMSDLQLAGKDVCGIARGSL